MSAKDILKEAMGSNSDIQRMLLPMALEIAIGSNRQGAGIDSEDELRRMLSIVADLIEQSIFSIASICHKIIESDNASDVDKLKDMLLDKSHLLSDLDTTACERLGLYSTSFESLCGKGQLRVCSCDNPWYEELIDRLPSWLNDISEHAMRLENTIEEKHTNVGVGYVTNIEILNPECIPMDFDDREEILDDYLKAEIPPFIMRYSDYREFVLRAISNRFGGYDASNKTHVLWRNKFMSVAIPFECTIDGFVETCIVLPYGYGKSWYRPYDSLEKRWIVDAPYISNTDAEQLIEIARRDPWVKPSFPEIAKKGNLW